MMGKVLKPYTIIPSNLYVERSADRQVKSIIEEMGRPGYVLVSRQMGKTNLLLNARRKYSNLQDRFVYVDLSNLFQDETGCFRNIIDTAIETNLDVFSGLDLVISKLRSEYQNLPPHKQHERELRVLLGSIEGKLVVILDEIDALTKCDYSDRIFSQIRSVYFARVNFDEFNRLTYLLSGVVEPSELIKDSKISPFNIGEKIFLNDFSKPEFQEFLQKAGMSDLEDAIKDRVYYWTSGNPRLTWDLLSVIEDEGEEISEERIDLIVKQHYLTSFDKPPIDNIREIVKNDNTLRDALIEIEYNKGNLITDSVKQKLYLAGIVNLNSDRVEIKNRIIKFSLSGNWIESLSKDGEYFLQKGIDYYNKSVFTLAVENLKKSLDSQTLSEIEVNLGKLYLGLSYYYASDYDNSKNLLTGLHLNRLDFGKLFALLKLHLGYIFIVERDYERAISEFEEVLKLGVLNELYLSAKIKVIQLGLIPEVHLNSENTLKMLDEIVSSDPSDYNIEDISILNEVKYLAGELVFEKGLLKFDTSKAIQYFENLLGAISGSIKSNVFLRLYKCAIDLPDIRSKYLVSALDNILESEIRPREKKHDFDNCFDVDKLRELELFLFRDNLLIEFERLIDYEIKIWRNSKEKILDKLIGFALANHFGDGFVVKLALYFAESATPTDEKIRKDLMTLLVSLSYQNEMNNREKYVLDYLEIILKYDTGDLDLDTVTLLSFSVNQFLRENQLTKVGFFMDRISEIKRRIPNALKDTLVIFEFLDFLYYKMSGDVSSALLKAQEILLLSRSPLVLNSKHAFVNNSMASIINECNSAIKELSRKMLLAKTVTPHRNEIVTVKYLNGDIKQVKYKKIENDLLNGICILLE